LKSRDGGCDEFFEVVGVFFKCNFSSNSRTLFVNSYSNAISSSRVSFSIGVFTVSGIMLVTTPFF